MPADNNSNDQDVRLRPVRQDTLLETFRVGGVNHEHFIKLLFYARRAPAAKVALHTLWPHEFARAVGFEALLSTFVCFELWHGCTLLPTFVRLAVQKLLSQI